MESKQESITISDEELKSINNAISARYGVDFSEYEITSLKRRIIRIIHKHGLNGIFGLWQKLLYDHEFIHTFRDEISVGLTEMFRNPDLWIFMRDELFRDKKELSLWHAGISTGEEVFSMSIMLKEMNLLQSSRLLATDLSSKFISLAQKGLIEKDQFNKYQNNYNTFNPSGNFKSYFTEAGDDLLVKTDLLRSTSFQQHNVLSQSPKELYDVIFCRNVMIYFNDELKLKTLHKFSQNLKKGGYLIIGYFDSMPDNFTQYFNYFSHGHKIFQKI